MQGASKGQVPKRQGASIHHITQEVRISQLVHRIVEWPVGVVDGAGQVTQMESVGGRECPRTKLVACAMTSLGDWIARVPGESAGWEVEIGCCGCGLGAVRKASRVRLGAVLSQCSSQDYNADTGKAMQEGA